MITTEWNLFKRLNVMKHEPKQQIHACYHILKKMFCKSMISNAKPRMGLNGAHLQLEL